MDEHGIDKSLKAFNTFIEQFEGFKSLDMSESDTRSKLIDFMFKDVLGWAEEDILREESVDSGYYDYKFSTSDFAFIVEAKKNFASFNLPERHRMVTLGTLFKGNKEVITQIRRYLFDKGLAFGVITNGHQYIVSQFLNTSGEDWKKNKALIFKSIDDVSENFIPFYNCLSRRTVIHNKILKVDRQLPSPHTLVDVIKGGSQILVRNDLSAQLAHVISQAFGELSAESKEHQKHLLESCYVKNEDIKKYNSELGLVLEDNPPAIDERIIKAKNTSSIHGQLKEHIYKGEGIPTSPPLMIIIGGKGVGKTTFIKNFFEIEIGEKSKLSRPSVYIDFRNYTEQDVQNSREIYQLIIDTLKKEYPKLQLSKRGVLKQMYREEIKELTDSLWAHLPQGRVHEKEAEFLEKKIEDPSAHLRKIASYLRNHCGKNLCIIFDNADQLSNDAQREAFLLANSLHQKLNCITIISLREGYYNRWKLKPPFDAFQSIVFHISAPPYREVVKKRIHFVEKNINFKEIESHYMGKKITITQDAFKRLFKNLYHTLFEVQNSELIKFLEETSFPNIRLGIEKINKFLVSGHTNIASYMFSDKYYIPIWEFVKSIALDSNKYYHSDQSLVVNLFKPAKGNHNHFTKVRLLLLLDMEWGGRINEESFTPVKNILDVFKIAGYSEEVVLDELTELLNYILIDNQVISSDIESDSRISILSSVRMTYSGAYYLKSMLSEFHYLSLVLQDTPIYDSEFFEKIKNSFPEVNNLGKSELTKRLESVHYFVDYLKEQEIFDHERSLVETFHPCLTYNIMDNSVANENYLKRIESIKGKLQQKSLI